MRHFIELSLPARFVSASCLGAILMELIVVVWPAAAAFHSGGVGSCQGCHVMHGSQEGMTVGTSPAGVPGLLLEETSSDVCLRCHADADGAVLGTNPLMPPPERGAGNFVFLFEDNLNDAADGALNPIPGDAAGHNVVAPAYGLAADARHGVSPGGFFPAAQLSCTSCHDPHGNAGFRMLHGAGPVQGGVAVLTAPAPQAEGIQLDGSAESNSLHTAYLSGMSEWCGNCHGRYHQDFQTPVVPGGGDPLEHPSDRALDGTTRNRYNTYNGDVDPTGGSAASAYLAAVPFEDRDALTSSTQGPGGGSRVMCLTCHRAHATSSPAAMRWDFRVSLLALDGSVSGSYPIPSPYPDPAQGTLCSKCHDGGTGALEEPAFRPSGD